MNDKNYNKNIVSTVRLKDKFVDLITYTTKEDIFKINYLNLHVNKYRKRINQN